MVLYCLIYLQIYLQDYRSPVPAYPAVTLETYFVVVCLSFWGRHQVLERNDNHSMHRNEHICAGLKQDSMWVWAQVLISVTNDLIVLSASPICGNGHMMHTGCIECQADVRLISKQDTAIQKAPACTFPAIVISLKNLFNSLHLVLRDSDLMGPEI